MFDFCYEFASNRAAFHFCNELASKRRPRPEQVGVQSEGSEAVVQRVDPVEGAAEAGAGASGGAPAEVSSLVP